MPFNRPQKLINRAKIGMSDANAAATAFFKEQNAEIVIEEEPETGFTVRKFRFKTSLPDTVEGRLTDALNNTRNAFDQILFAACLAIDRPLKDGHYPWSDSAPDLTSWKLQNSKTGKETTPKELWDVLISQEPYPRNEANGRGDTLIRSMAALANRKHTVGIEVQGRVASINFGISIAGPGEGAYLLPRWDSAKNEIVLARWKGAEVQFDRKESLGFDIVFNAEAPDPLPGKSAFDCMSRFIEHAQSVCDGLKARAAELGAK